MAQDCMKSATIEETKACLRQKIEIIHNENMEFHKEIEKAILLSKDAIIDFKLTELTDNVNRLAAERKFSAGKFFCDLLLQVALGPVFGTVLGHAVKTRLNAIIKVRGGIKGIEPTVVNARVRTEKQLDELALDLLAKVVEKRARPTELNELSTGIVVDSFQKISESLSQLRTAPQGEVTPYRNSGPFDKAVTSHVPTNLQMITKNADNYFKFQSLANSQQRFILEWLLAPIEEPKSLETYQKFLDDTVKTFTETQKNADVWKLEIQNLAATVGILLYFGDPREWAVSKVEKKRVRQGTEMDVYTYVDFVIKWPDTLVDQVLRNILIPGRLETFLSYYTRLKRVELSRTTGLGVTTSRGTHSELEDSPPILPVTSTKSEYFTAKQTAFAFFRFYAMSVYDDLIKTEYDVFFQNLLERHSLLPVTTSPVGPSQ